ncbi:hypothetical protein [Streptomyces sp. NPDC055099]
MVRIDGARWQITRSGRTSRSLATVTNLSDPAEAERMLHITASKPGVPTVGGLACGAGSHADGQ